MRYLIAVLAVLAMAAPTAQAGTISGTVENSSGTSVGGVPVNAVRVTPLAIVASTTTAADGSYTLANIPDGSFAVAFAFGHPSLIAEAYEDIYELDELELARQFDVTATSSVTGIDATLLTGHRLRGTVSGPDGPVAGAAITAISDDGDYAGETTTDAAGAYDFYVRDPDAATDPVYVEYEGPPGSLYAGQARRNLLLPPESTSTINVELALGGAISGRVTDTGGLPFPSASVRIDEVGGGFFRQEQVSADGSYVARGLPAGEYTVSFTVTDPVGGTSEQFFDGKRTYSEANRVRVASGEVTGSINGNIPRPGGVSGFVGDGTTPLPSASVVVFRPNGERVITSSVDADGNYTVNGLEPGSYRVLFEPGRVFAQRWYDAKTTLASAEPVTVEPGALTTGIDATFTGAQIVGRVTVPYPNLGAEAVRAFDSDDEEVAFDDVEPDGSYRLAGLLPGEYRLVFSAPEALPESRAVSVVATETITLNPVLSKGAVFQGGVRRDDGEPLFYVEVQIFRADGTFAASARTNQAGRYRIAGLPAGAYKVYFASPFQRQTESEYHFNKRSLAAADPITVGAPSTTTISAVLRSTGAISGTIRTEDGRPLRNAQAFPIREDGLRAGPITTTSAGTYTARRLLPGRWKIYFKPPLSTYAGEYHLNKSTLAEADWLTVTAKGELTGVDGSLARREPG